LAQKILYKTKSKAQIQKSKTLVLGQGQLLMLASGEIVSIEDLGNYSPYPSIIAWKDEFTFNRIVSIKKVKENIMHLRSSHGRNLYCGKDTKLTRGPLCKEEYLTAQSLKEYPETFRGSPREVNACAFRHLPFFGTWSPSKLYLDSLGSSIIRVNNSRPNYYTKQWVPAALTKLSQSALTYILDKFILPLQTLKHLTTDSKDIMIQTLSKLFIPFDGQVKGHKAVQGCGTIKLPEICKELPVLKKESMRFVEDTEQTAFMLTFENNSSPIISGLLICLNK